MAISRAAFKTSSASTFEMLTIFFASDRGIMENCIQSNPGTFQIFSNALWPLQFSRPQRTICLGTMWTFSFHIFRWHSDFLVSRRTQSPCLQHAATPPWKTLWKSRQRNVNFTPHQSPSWAASWQEGRWRLSRWRFGLWVNGPLPRHWSIPNSFLFSAFKTSSVFHSSHLGFSSPTLRIYSSAM